MKNKLTEEIVRLAAIQYELGGNSIKDLAEAFDVSYDALRKRFSSDGIKRGCRYKPEDFQTSDPVIQQIQRDYVRWLDAVSKTSIALIGKARNDNVSIAMFEDELRSLKLVSDLLGKNCTVLMKLFAQTGNSQSDELPTFTVTEMTADDVQELRDEQKELLAELVNDEEDNDVQRTIVE